MASKDPVAEAMAAFGLAKGAARELTDGAIRCSVPECGGIVKSDFVIRSANGKPLTTPVGLCPQIEVHKALAATNPAAKLALGSLLQMNRVRRIQER